MTSLESRLAAVNARIANYVNVGSITAHSRLIEEHAGLPLELTGNYRLEIVNEVTNQPPTTAAEVAELTRLCGTIGKVEHYSTDHDPIRGIVATYILTPAELLFRVYRTTRTTPREYLCEESRRLYPDQAQWTQIKARADVYRVSIDRGLSMVRELSESTTNEGYTIGREFISQGS